MDVTANQMLASRDIDAPVEPASLTKLMTAYLVFDALRAKKIDLEAGAARVAARLEDARLAHVHRSQMKVPVEDLIKGMIVQSGNDATVALAEGVGGTVERFVELMNQQAKALGMKNTSYNNPEGLTAAGHTTTARDLSILSTRLMQDFPEYVSYYTIQKYRYQGTPTANDTNRNMLLFRDPTVDGTEDRAHRSGRLLPDRHRQARLPQPAGRRLMAIVLGANSETGRANEAQKLLNWGYTAYEAIKLFDANQAVVTPEVWKGAQKTPAGPAGGVVLAVPAGSAADQDPGGPPRSLDGPFTKGQRSEPSRSWPGDQPLLDVPLVALEPVRAGRASSAGAWDALRLWINDGRH